MLIPAMLIRRPQARQLPLQQTEFSAWHQTEHLLGRPHGEIQRCVRMEQTLLTDLLMAIPGTRGTCFTSYIPTNTTASLTQLGICIPMISKTPLTIYALASCRTDMQT